MLCLSFFIYLICKILIFTGYFSDKIQGFCLWSTVNFKMGFSVLAFDLQCCLSKPSAGSYHEKIIQMFVYTASLTI